MQIQEFYFVCSTKTCIEDILQLEIKKWQECSANTAQINGLVKLWYFLIVGQDRV